MPNFDLAMAARVVQERKMRTRLYRSGFALIAVSVSATLVGTAGGDIIELKTGQRVDAKVLVVSPEAGVVVDQDGTKAIITLDQVRAIYFGSDAPATGSLSNLVAAHRAKARLDARARETAVVNYTMTFGSLPQSLDALTRRSEIAGASGGPFIREVPTPPPGLVAVLLCPHARRRVLDHHGGRRDDGTRAGALMRTARPRAEPHGL